MSDYSDASQTLTKQLTRETKKKQGIFFTPPICINSIIAMLEPYMENISSILEPSCGSGEFITTLGDMYPTKIITGIELNTTIYNTVAPVLTNDKVTIYNEDFLTYTPMTDYQLIIGNPPFSVLTKKSVSSEYYPYFDGRPNIFIIFIIKSLKMLIDDGILCFVLPSNFRNCLYYDKTRKYITETCDLLYIGEGIGQYLETQQDTIIMILRKGRTEMKTNYMLRVSDNLSFVPENIIETIRKLRLNSSTMKEMGYQLTIGTVVWNQCTDILTDDNSETLLIYSSDFTQNKLAPKSYSNPKKKNYIRREGQNKLVLVVNRGYGKGKYNLNYCIIDVDYPYLLENHVIVIEYKGEDADTKSHSELYNMYMGLVTSLNDKRTNEFVQLYFGNNAINTTEMSSILPIYL